MHFGKSMYDLELPQESLKIKHLHLNFSSECIPAACLSVFLEKCHNVQILDLSNGTMEEIFIKERVSGGEEPHAFTQLNTLEIYGMDKLTHVWKESSRHVFPNLEVLKVKWCGGLKDVVSSAVSFSNVVQLEVLYCHGMEHLITFSVAKILVQLRSIRVEYCRRMKEIVASSDVEAGNEVTFGRLEELRLCNLPDLRGFCFQDYNVRFPFLKILSVTNCREMKIFEGVLLKDSKHQGLGESGDDLDLDLDQMVMLFYFHTDILFSLSF